jgi:hypothetical protein
MNFFVGLYFKMTKNFMLPDKIAFCRIENAFCWTKLHFVGLNCILEFSFNKLLIFQEFGQN